MAKEGFYEDNNCIKTQSLPERIPATGKGGGEVLVTERGRPIARLAPTVGSKLLPEQLVEMEKQGLIKLGSGKLPKDFWDLPRPKDPKGSVVKTVLREREEGCRVG